MIYIDLAVLFISSVSAHKCGDPGSQHRVQLPHDGERQIHLRQGEGESLFLSPLSSSFISPSNSAGCRQQSSGHHRHVRPDQPHQKAYQCRQRHHEPRQQGDRSEGSENPADLQH